MRSISDEIFLRIKSLSHAMKQKIELMNQGANFIRQIVFDQFFKFIGLPCGNLLAYPRNRCQRSAHHPPDHQHQQRHHQQNWSDCAQRQGTGNLAPGGNILRYLYHLRTGCHGKQAVSGSSGLHGGKPQHGTLRQFGPRSGLEYAQTVRGPDLDHKVKILFIIGDKPLLDMATYRQPRAQRQGHLLHLEIKNIISLSQCRAVGDDGLRTGSQKNGGEQQPQQPGPQGMRHRYFHEPALGIM
ncbi:hypothetical protein GALL_470430 [mine drainage metagenome]|uniref:Uncharacterized protein n=1 Tax=mine drainage metagenome TaxID=410659 RepID=A0A1J5PIL8_9ZZZZ